uniref:PAT complex subunit Asterix n=1 Tax=Lepisosteus oculatus TaxID=7918 RepID=W5MH90_LEPOC
MWIVGTSDPRRPNKIQRYKPPSTDTNPTLEDPTPDYMNLLGMIFSMCGLMLKAVHLGRSDVIPAEPPAHVPTLVTKTRHGEAPKNNRAWSIRTQSSCAAAQTPGEGEEGESFLIAHSSALPVTPQPSRPSSSPSHSLSPFLSLMIFYLHCETLDSIWNKTHRF